MAAKSHRREYHVLKQRRDVGVGDGLKTRQRGFLKLATQLGFCKNAWTL